MGQKKLTSTKNLPFIGEVRKQMILIYLGEKNNNFLDVCAYTQTPVKFQMLYSLN